MDNEQLDWRTVDTMGAELGASEASRLKWRQRTVPPAWRIKIAEALEARGKGVPLSAFDRLPNNPGRIAA